MASFSDRVKVLIDVDSTGATSGLVNFRKSFSEAQTATAKWKVVTGGAMDFVKNNAMTMAAGAGAAIAGFAVKAIGDFQKLALEVDHFSDVTGLAAEEASRWIEVAGDMGIESSTVESAINRMNREIGKGTDKFEALGIELERTSGGAIDVNETFLNVIDRLKGIQDPAERARVAAELLGKGWTGMAELVETGSDSLRQSLESVSGAKVIDEEEIEKAKRLREMQDNLSDAVEGFALALGETLLPALVEIAGPLEWFAKKIQEATDEGYKMSDGALVTIGKWLGIVEKEAANTADTVDDDLVTAWEQGYRAMIDARDAADDLVYSLEDVDYALQVLKGEVDERQTWRNLQDSFDQVKQKAIEAFTEGTPQAIRDSEAALDDLRVEVAEYITEIDGISTEKKTEFLAKIDKATFQELEDLLDFLSRRREVEFVPTVNGKPVGKGETPSEVNPQTLKQMGIGTPRLDLTPSKNTMSLVVNVAGSVTTEKDLVETIRKGLVQAQRSGYQLVL